MSARVEDRRATVERLFVELRRLVGTDIERFTNLLWTRANDIGEYLRSFILEGTDQAFTNAYVGDALPRFLRTLEFITGHPARILEIGSNPYFFHTLLKKLLPGVELSGMNFFDHNIFSDHQSAMTQTTFSAVHGERYPFESKLFNLEAVVKYPYPDDHFDLVFFCETLEHLAIDPLQVFGRLRRIIRPRGHLMITLPNAVRLSNFGLMLEGYNMFDIYHPQNGVHGRHNREFTLDEMKRILTDNRYEVVRADTYDRFDYDIIPIGTADYTGVSTVVGRTKTQLIDILRSTGARLNDRGDNLYVLARRTA